MLGIFWKSRSFPFISVRLSRGLGWDVGVNGGVEGGFGGEIHGFVVPVGAFGGAAFVGKVLGCGHWDGPEMAAGQILGARYPW